MQLAGITISNLFSFPYLADVEHAQEVTFHNIEKDNVNVLIGPNGAGKSKFLEIIWSVFKVGFMKDYLVDQAKLESTDPREQQSAITVDPVLLDRIYKHFTTPDKPSEVRLRLGLTWHDDENLRFLCEHIADINALIARYSTLALVFPQVAYQDIVLPTHSITFHCLFDIDHQQIQFAQDTLSPAEAFVLQYLTHIELIQICIDIHNMQQQNTQWPDMHTTFGMLGFTRSMETISPLLRPDAWEWLVFQKNNGQYSSYAGYYLCAKKLWKVMAPHCDDPVMLQAKLNESEFYLSLSSAIRKYFAKTLQVAYHDGSIDFSFADAYGNILHFVDLSDGEQSLMVMLMAIYGYDLKWWLLIIDEPEIHFHPQMQRSLSRMMEKVSENIGTQFILSTYSPLFINESNISNVYRFANVDGATTIKNPDVSLSDDEASLVHLLKFENMSKIFFVNNIIMVEWETDAYFFDFYLQYLHSLPQWKGKITDYEIININGKWSYKLWKKFLSRFGINSYFIWDRDNIVDYGFLSQDELNHYYKEARAYFPKIRKKLTKWSHYNKLVLTIKDLFNAKYNSLLSHINELYKYNVFLLKQGDIETYIPLKEKGLEYIVAFCHHDFKKWLNNSQYEPYREEFDEIVSHIFLW